MKRESISNNILRKQKISNLKVKKRGILSAQSKNGFLTIFSFFSSRINYLNFYISKIHEQKIFTPRGVRDFHPWITILTPLLNGKCRLFSLWELSIRHITGMTFYSHEIRILHVMKFKISAKVRRGDKIGKKYWRKGKAREVSLWVDWFGIQRR